MCTGAWTITQTGQGICQQQELQGEEPQLPVWAHRATLQDHKDLQLHFTAAGGIQHMWNTKMQPHTHPRSSTLVLAPTQGNPTAQSLHPPIYHELPFTSHQTQKPNRENQPGQGVHTPSWLLPCAFTHHHVIETLNFLGPKSRAISCSKVNAASHTAMSTRLLPTASKYQKVAHSFSTQQIQNYNKGIIINICLAPDL